MYLQYRVGNEWMSLAKTPGKSGGWRFCGKFVLSAVGKYPYTCHLLFSNLFSFSVLSRLASLAFGYGYSLAFGYGYQFSLPTSPLSPLLYPYSLRSLLTEGLWLCLSSPPPSPTRFWLLPSPLPLPIIFFSLSPSYLTYPLC